MIYLSTPAWAVDSGTAWLSAWSCGGEGTTLLVLQVAGLAGITAGITTAGITGCKM